MSIYWNVCAYICVQKFNIKFNRDLSSWYKFFGTRMKTSLGKE